MLGLKFRVRFRVRFRVKFRVRFRVRLRVMPLFDDLDDAFQMRNLHAIRVRVRVRVRDAQPPQIADAPQPPLRPPTPLRSCSLLWPHPSMLHGGSPIRVRVRVRVRINSLNYFIKAVLSALEAPSILISDRFCGLHLEKH